MAVSLLSRYATSDFLAISDVWLTVHRNSVWIRNQLDVTLCYPFFLLYKLLNMFLQLLKMGTWLPETCWTTCKEEIKDNTKWHLVGLSVLSRYMYSTIKHVHCNVCYSQVHTLKCGPGSLVGIATDYGLDGPGSNPGGDEIFRPSRPGSPSLL